MTDKVISGFICNTPDEVKRFLEKYFTEIELANLESQVNHISKGNKESFARLLEFADCSDSKKQFEKYIVEQPERVEAELTSLAVMIRIAISNSSFWTASYLILNFRYIVNIKITGKTDTNSKAFRPSPFVYAMQ